jgi:hypothetical protein
MSSLNGQSSARPNSNARGCGSREMTSLVEKHFAQRITPAGERRLRAHLLECSGCRDLYSAQLLLERIVRGGDRFESRLGRGLGFVRPAPQTQQSPLVWPALTGLAAAMTLLLALLPLGHQSSQSATKRPTFGEAAGGFATRGSDALSTHGGCELAIYRVQRDNPTRSRRVRGRVRASDELAFAYRNGCEKRRLLVFGVDSNQNIYWYYPAWRQAELDPVALPIEAGRQLRELPWAISHALREGTLTVYAVFTDETLTVRAVERRIRSGAEKLAPDAIQRRYPITITGHAP